MAVDKIHVQPEIKEEEENKLDVLQTLALPENLYSAAIVLPLEKFDASSNWNRFIHFQTIFMVGVNFFIQGTLIGYLYHITLKNASDYGECGNYTLEPMVYRLCVLIYIMYCFADMMETFEMVYWFRTITDSKMHGIRENGFIDRETTSSKLMYKIVDEDDDVTEDLLSNANKIHRISSNYTAYVYGCVLFPKFFLAMSVLLIGTGFIVNTDADENLILNALALGFILELDEMAYEFIANPQWQECVQTIPRIQVLGDETKSGFFKRFGVPLKIAGFGVLTWGALTYWCPNSE